MSLLRAFARRPLADTALVAHALVVHIAVATLLRPLGLQRLTRGLARASQRRVFRGKLRRTCDRVEDRVVWAVRTGTHLIPFGRTCLTEALAAQYLVRRHGGDAELRLGVSRGSSLHAHAWLEAAGRIIIGGEDAAIYAPLALPRR